MADVYDVDAASQDFNPVRVKFRGAEYELGNDVVGLVRAAAMFQSADEEDGKQVMEKLPAILVALSPALAPVLEEKALGSAEAVAFVPAAQEALTRFARFRSSAEEAAG